MSRLLDFLTHGGIIVSLAGVGAAAASLLLSGIPLFSTETLVVFIYAFLVMFSVYRINKILELKEDVVNRPDRVAYLAGSGKKMLIYGVPAITYALALVIAFMSNAYVFAITVISFLWIVAYTLEFPGWLQRIVGYPKIKAIPVIKTIYSAIAWGALGVAAIFFFKPEISTALFIPFLFVFLRLFINTNIFDMRDVQGDKKSGIKTIPVIIGLKKTQSLQYALNLAVIFLLASWVFLGLVPKSSVALLAACFFAFYYIGKSTDPRFDKNFLCDVLTDGEAALWIPLSLIASVFSF